MIDNDTILRFIAAHHGCTCAQIADACRISSRLMATKLRTLSKAGTIQSVKIRDGKNLSGYYMARKRREHVERGPYVPPPGPLRYEPRNVGTVRLTGYRWVSED